MEHIEEPGVTLCLKKGTVAALPANPKEYRGEVTLDVVVKDKELWDVVIGRLNGMCVYRGDDIKTELIEILRAQIVQMEAQQTAERRNYASELEHLRQQNSFLEGERARLSQRVAVLENLLKAYGSTDV